MSHRLFSKVYTCKSIRRAFATEFVETVTDFITLHLAPPKYNPLQHTSLKTTINIYANSEARDKDKSDARTAAKYGYCVPADPDEKPWMQQVQKQKINVYRYKVFEIFEKQTWVT